MKEALRQYIENNLDIIAPIQLCENASYNSALFGDVVQNDDKISYKRSRRDISDYIKENKENSGFQDLLFKYIDERNLRDSEVYNKVHIDRRLFSKIRSDNTYHPSKETIILLGFALELDEDEIVKLLEKASYSLPKNNYYDLILRFCFINKIYNLNEVNELLDEYGCKQFYY